MSHRRRRFWPMALAVAMVVPATAATAAPDEGAAGMPIAVDEAASTGIAQLTNTWDSTIADFDGDGWPDILLGRHGQGPAQLWINDRKGRFDQVDAGTFVRQDRHGCGAGDVNGDGRLDVFCGIGAGSGTAVKSDNLWIQGPGLTFTDQAATWGVADPFGRGRTVAVFDADHDGRPDLFVGNEEERPDGIPSPNRLFLDRGGTRFVDAPELGLDAELGAACAQPADVDGDGYVDLLLCPGQGGLKLFRNDRGTGFVDVSTSSGIGGDVGCRALLVDLDGDHRPDLVEVFPDLLQVRLQTASGTFATRFSMPLTGGRMAAAGDVNGDGRPDLYVLQGGGSSNTPDLMLLNDGTGTGFTRMDIPETAQGVADTVRTLDYDRNGYADFLVLNGGSSKNGPVQLIAFFPRQAAGRPGPAELTAAPGRAPPAWRTRPAGSRDAAGLRGADPAVAGPSPCGPSWSQVDTPPLGAKENGMSGLAVLGPADVWAVGHQHPAGPDLTPAAEHWDGTAWTAVPGPDPGGGSAGLNAVSGSSGTDAWAVGFSSPNGTGAGYAGLIEHWDGTAWSLGSAPAVPADSHSLIGVSATSSSSAWAVGYRSTGGLVQPLIEHWNGTAWSVASTPSLPGNSELLDVAAASPRDVWAVGRAASGTLPRTLVEHWNGAAWSVVASPNAGTGPNVLTGLAVASSDDVWAVGYANRTGFQSLVEHWDGLAWTIAPSPQPGSWFDVLRGATAVAGGDVWAAGVFYDDARAAYSPLVTHWDGTGWSAFPVPDRRGDRELSAVASSGRDLWAAGWSDSNGSVVSEHACPVQVLDDRFVPGAGGVAQGAGVAWSLPVSDAGSHTVTDATGMSLFESGPRAPGSSFTYVYVGAGSYAVLDTVTSARSTVSIPLTVRPAAGGAGTTFTLTWSSADAAAGFGFDVQVRRPGSGLWQPLFQGVTGTGGGFVPDAGSGAYSFRGRMRNTGDGSHAGWSGVVTVSVT